MRNVFLTLVLLLGFQGLAEACDFQSVEEARQILARSQQRNNHGALPASDLQIARTHWLEMRFCQTPNDKRLCAELVESLQKDFENAQAGMSSGLTTVTGLVQIHDKVARTRVQCGG